MQHYSVLMELGQGGAILKQMEWAHGTGPSGRTLKQDWFFFFSLPVDRGVPLGSIPRYVPVVLCPEVRKSGSPGSREVQGSRFEFLQYALMINLI